MIMMDVTSMYGQSSAPSYNPSDTNYYNNYGNSSSDHSMAPHHQYSGGAVGGYPGAVGYHGASLYDEATYLYGVSGASTDSGVETPPSPQDPQFYPHQQNPPPETSIINTETGLSYTNLDYANANGSMYPHQPGYSEDSISGPYGSVRPPHDLLMRHHDDSNDGSYQYLHDSKYHPHQLEEGYHHHHHPHIVSPGQGNMGCMDFQQLQTRYKEEIMGDGRLRQHPGMSNMGGGQPQHPVIPTYKWMQVKRNIPKPTGK